MTLGLSISSVSEVCGTFVRRELVEQVSNTPPGVLNATLSGFAHQMFEFGEDLLNGVKVGRVGRQEQQPGSSTPDRPAHGGAFVTAQIVHDNDVIGLEGWREQLLDISLEALAVDWPVKHARRVDPVMAQGRQECQRFPVSIGRLGAKAAPFRAPATQRRHVGFGPGFVNEDEAFGVNPALIFLPLFAPAGDLWTILFGGKNGFFYSSALRRGQKPKPNGNPLSPRVAPVRPPVRAV